MTFKSYEQPFCRCCGKKIPKETQMAWVMHKSFRKSTYPHDERWFFDYLPQTKEEIDRRLHEITGGTFKVKAVRYQNGYSTYDPSTGCSSIFLPSVSQRYIYMFTYWDNMSYKDEFFCAQPCAVDFAYATARQGFSTPAYRERIKA